MQFRMLFTVLPYLKSLGYTSEVLIVPTPGKKVPRCSNANAPYSESVLSRFILIFKSMLKQIRLCHTVCKIYLLHTQCYIEDYLPGIFLRQPKESTMYFEIDSDSVFSP